MSAFNNQLDIHSATAAEIFSMPLAEVGSEQRRYAKAVNFGLIYGMSAFGLARQLNVERKEAQNYIDQYFARYPGVKRYMDTTREAAHESGYVETIFGRRLYLPDINSRNHNMRQYAERTAINAPMQGSAADIIKRAMIAVDAWLSQQNLDVQMIMQVHDELVLEVPNDAVDNVIERLTALMQDVVTLRVPLIVDAASAANWSAAH